MSIATAKPKPLPRIVAPSSCTLIPDTSIAVTILATPPAELSPNARVHYQVRARATRHLRQAAYLATCNVIVAARLGREATPFPVGTRLAVNATIGWEAGRKPQDGDNAKASLKSAFDGFADAIGIDDAWFVIGAVEQVRDYDGLGFTRIECELAAGTEP